MKDEQKAHILNPDIIIEKDGREAQASLTELCDFQREMHRVGQGQEVVENIQISQ